MARQITEIFRKPTTRIKSIAFHPVQPTFLTANHCGTIYLWSTHYAQVVRTLSEHTGSVRAVRFHPSGEIFATGGDDKIVRVWNYRTLEVAHRLKGHTDYVRSVSFHPTHPWLISASDDCTVKIWNYYTGEMISSSSGHHHYVMAALFLDSAHFVTASLDHTIGLWNCSNLLDPNKKFLLPGAVLHQTVEGHERGVNTLFFKDGYLYSGADDREIKKWKYSGGILNLEHTFYAHEGNVTSVSEINGSCLGASEDGTLSLNGSRKKERIDLGSRLWAVASKDDCIAVGTDDGLVFYSYRDMLLATRTMNGTVWFTQDGCLKQLNCSNGVISGDFSVQKDAKRLREHSGNRTLIQYLNTYEIVEDNRRVERGSGQLVTTLKCTYKLKDSVLTRDGDMIAEDAAGTMISGVSGIYLISGHSVKYHSDDTDSPILYSCNFEIKDAVASSSGVALSGSGRIIVLSASLEFVASLNERCAVLGMLYLPLGVILNEGGSCEDVLIYTTTRQLKYFYEKEGVLASLERPLVPMNLESGLFFGLGARGVEKIQVSLSELLFRKAVAENGDILGVIDKEHLPGLSPLNYLIRRGKGAIALPYLKDNKSKFDVLVSSGEFEGAFELCETRKMYEKLAEHAVKGCKVDVAERCFRELDDSVGLFFLYLCCGDMAKLKELGGDEVDAMVKVVLGDCSLLSGYSVAEELENMRVDGPCEVSSSTEKTGYATMNDSEVCLGLFDTDMLHSSEIPDESVDELVKVALDLTTEGKFQKAVDSFRKAILSIAVQMRGSEDFLELRKKIGMYLWGLHVEIERRKVKDSARSLQMSLFFASLPFEEKHRELAQRLAMNTCFKRGNIRTAKEFAKRFASNAVAQKILADPSDEDAVTVTVGDVCYDTLAVEAETHTCSLCFVGSNSGSQCGACLIGLLD